MANETSSPHRTRRLSMRRLYAWLWFGCLHSLRIGRQALRWFLRLLLVLYFGLAVLVLSLRYLILPQVSDYKSEVEQMISASLGRRVEIAGLQARWSGLHPELQLTDVVLHDQAGAAALSLPEVNATLSWLSLPLATLRFDKIELQKPSLAMLRDRTGRLFVGGFYIDPKQKNDGKGLDWVFDQHQISIRSGQLSWTDQQRGLPAIELSEVNFVLQNRWRRHQFALKALPPEQLAAPLDIRGDFQHKAFTSRPSDFSGWSGDLYADLRQASLPGWLAYAGLPLPISSANGAVRAWLHLDQGRIAELTADLSLRQVAGRLGEGLPTIDLQQLSGRVVLSEKQDFGKKYLPALFGKAGHTLELQQLRLTGSDGQALAPMSLREEFTPASGHQPQQVSVQIGYVDLQVLAGLALHLPLPEDQRKMLADFAPSGQLKNFKASWKGVYPALASYQLAGEFQNLSLQAQPAQLAQARTARQPARAAVPAIPGFSHLTGSLYANDQGGRFELDSQNLLLNMPGYFVDPAMPFAKLSMAAAWHFEKGDMLRFEIQKMEAQQDGMRLKLNGSHVFPMQQQGNNSQPGQVDLTAHADGVDLKQLDRYIPVITEPNLKHWLLTSIRDGRADDVSLILRGDLAAFPFAANDVHGRSKGEFVVRGKLNNARLDFTAGELAEGGKAPLWPWIEQINGSFVFERAQMEIYADTARTLGADLRRVKAVIPDLLAHDPVLSIDGNAASSLQQMLAYVGASPVDGWLGHFLAEAKAGGNASLNLKLQLPLNHVEDTKVQGQLQFAGNEVSLQPAIPVVSGLNGRLDFNERGVALNTLKGSALGGALVISGGSQKDGSIRIRLDGSASGSGLTDYLPEPARSQLAGKLIGTTRYQTSIAVKKQLPEIIIEAPLQGLALQLPAPLQKNASELLPLRIDILPRVSEGSVLQDELRLRLGNLLQARYWRQKPNDKNADWQVLRGGIGINTAAPEPAAGVQMHVDVASLNLDEWQQLAQLSSGTGSSGSTGGNSAALSLAAYLNADTLTLKTEQLQTAGKRLDQVLLGMTRERNAWHGNIDARQMAGYFRWREPAGSAGSELMARFSRLSIPQSAASDVADLLEHRQATTRLPDLDINADQFELLNKQLGRLELRASNRGSASGNEWHLDRVLLNNDDAELSATGQWSGKAGGRTQLDFVLKLANSGQLLERFGFVNVIRGGRGKLEGRINWSGLPIAMDLPSMGGHLQIDIEAGQFMKVDPGAAKLLGVLSMQSLPRRLTLDFRDVFSGGFAFDAITGSARIENGIAQTDNLKMRGVSATVLMGGSADIARETQQLHVAVIPVVNAGAASVVYGLAVNPVIGLGTFLAQLFLREPLAKAFTFEYAVSGSWTDPVVKKLEHNSSQDVSVTPAGSGSKEKS